MRLYLKNLTFFLFTVSVTCSCNLTGDYVLDYGNLKVYYDQEDSKKIAENFAAYWKKENYLGDRTQNIKLVLDEKKEIYQEDSDDSIGNIPESEDEGGYGDNEGDDDLEIDYEDIKRKGKGRRFYYCKNR